MTSTEKTAPRLATQIAFWVAGFGVSAWAPLVPYAKQRLAVDDQTLGLLLLCLGIGSVVAMIRTGPLCTRYGSRPVILAGGLGMALLLPALATANSIWLMAFCLLIFGGALGSLDVAMNVHAVEVERFTGRPMMSGFHAFFSVGGFCGATLVTALLANELAPLTVTFVCANLMLGSLAVTISRLLDTADPHENHFEGLMNLPRGPVVILSVLAAITFLVEGAMLDWSALLITDLGLSTPERAGVGYALFAVAMTVGRFSGDVITARFGDKNVMVWGGLTVLCGFTCLLMFNSYELALIGFALIGLGASNVVPVLFRQAGRQNVMPAALAISAVTTIGYAGLLVGPAIVGFVSKQASLQTGFWMLAALMCLVPIFGRAGSSSKMESTSTI